jgi:hypothetical protein
MGGVKIMKYFKNEKNSVFAFESDGTQDEYIGKELILITELEADELRKPTPESEPSIPEIVSMRQARLALLHSGLLSTVSEAIASGSEADQIEWEYATEVYRNQPLVQNMKAGLGLTDPDLDNLFTLAASL